jgi:hypothetical protein
VEDTVQRSAREGEGEAVYARVEQLFKDFEDNPSMMAVKAAALRYLRSEVGHDAGT